MDYNVELRFQEIQDGDFVNRYLPITKVGNVEGLLSAGKISGGLIPAYIAGGLKYKGDLTSANDGDTVKDIISAAFTGIPNETTDSLYRYFVVKDDITIYSDFDGLVAAPHSAVNYNVGISLHEGDWLVMRSKSVSYSVEGTWDIGTQYNVGELVEHGGFTFVCRYQHTGSEPDDTTPASTSAWSYTGGGTVPPDAWAVDLVDNTLYVHPTGAGTNHLEAGGTIDDIYIQGGVSGDGSWQTPNNALNRNFGGDGSNTDVLVRGDHTHDYDKYTEWQLYMEGALVHNVDPGDAKGAVVDFNAGANAGISYSDPSIFIHLPNAHEYGNISEIDSGNVLKIVSPSRTKEGILKYATNYFRDSLANLNIINADDVVVGSIAFANA